MHWQLTSRDARLVRRCRTAPAYRLYAMANATPPKPALVHVGEGGAAIEVEVYELGVAAFGGFVAEVPPPLAIGTVTLEDGTDVKGFVAEPRALDGRRRHHRARRLARLHGKPRPGRLGWRSRPRNLWCVVGQDAAPLPPLDRRARWRMRAPCRPPF